MNLKKNISKIDWNNFLINSDQHNIFSEYRYLDILDSKFSNYVLEKEGDYLCGLIIFEENLNEIPIIYNSIILNKKIKKPHKKTQIISKFLELLNKEKTKIHVRSHYSLDDIRAFSWFNYNQKDKNKKFEILPFYTGIIDISNRTYEDIVLNFSYSRRREMKIAKEKYFTKKSSEFEKFDNLNKLTFNRTKERNSLEFFFSNQLLKMSIENNFGSCLITENKKKEAIAASFFIHDHNCSYYIAGGFNKKEDDKYASSLNIAEHINYCIKKKQKLIDFCGVNSPDRGFFKTSFGAKLSLYFEMIL